MQVTNILLGTAVVSLEYLIAWTVVDYRMRKGAKLREKRRLRKTRGQDAPGI